MNRSENMRRIRGKDTIPELRIRRLVHRLGYRYRLHRRDLPGCPDLVFSKLKKVIFVHGCFWHQHEGCGLGHIPKTNRRYWTAKLRRNVERSEKQRRKLATIGWHSLIIWECQTKDLEGVSSGIERFLKTRS